MADTDSFIQGPADSTGKKLATREHLSGGQTVQTQEVLAAFQRDSVSTGFNATISSTEARPPNVNRRGISIQNLSDTRVIGRFGAAPVASAGAEVGFAIEPNGGVWAPPFGLVDTRALNVIHAGSGGKRLLITEW